MTGLTKGVDNDTNLPFWQWRSQGVLIRLVQRLPDQSRAYFMARSFSAEDAENIAGNCVFQTIFKNIASVESNLVVDYDLTQWRISTGNKKQGLKLKEHWVALWKLKKGKLKKISKSSQIAFEWSLLPTLQQYQPGDFNWGMALFGLDPGSEFDLHLVWYENKIKMQADIKSLQCAADIHPEPEIGD